MNNRLCISIMLILIGSSPYISGETLLEKSSIAFAFETSQQSSRINQVSQFPVSQSQDQSEKVYFNRQKVNFLEQLKQEKKQLPTDVLGMPESDFKQAAGKIGYVQTGLSLNLKEIFPIPKVGTVANRTGSQTLIFKFMGLVDRSGTIMMADPLPVSSGYRITAYRLMTGFLDSSQQFYQLYYQVKYQESQP